MIKLILLLLLSSGIYAQDQVFNVQRYCIDKIPFNKAQCDVSGNDYSFVFIDTKKKEVVFFLSDTKMKYKILSTVAASSINNFATYTLENEKGQLEMKVNKGKTKIEFLYPDNHIYLTVGKSTKLGT